MNTTKTFLNYLADGIDICVTEKRTYRKRAIISRGCIFFTPFFTAVYNLERLILETIYVGNSSKKSAVYNQERVIMARVRYAKN